MIERLRRDWRLLSSGAPGERFARYHHARRAPGGLRRLVAMAAGVLVVLIGLVLLPAPGPGIVVVALGAALLAGESVAVARLLDRCESRVRAAVRRWRRR